MCRILKMHLILYSSYVSCHDIRSFNSHFKKYVVKWSSRIFHLCSIKLNYTLVNPSKLKNLISDWEKMCYRKKGAWCGIIIIFLFEIGAKSLRYKSFFFPDFPSKLNNLLCLEPNFFLLKDVLCFNGAWNLCPQELIWTKREAKKRETKFFQLLF